MRPADQTSRLIGEVASRCGIRLDPDDPAFALVALNQLVLEEAVEHLTARIKMTAAELEHSGEGIGLRAGIAVAEQIRNAQSRPSANLIQPETQRDQDNWPAKRNAPARWIAIGAASGLLLFGLGVLVGARVL